MKAVKPRFGQADKKQQQLTSHLRSSLCGATERTRTGWLWELRQDALEQPHHVSSPRPVWTEGCPSPVQGQCPALRDGHPQHEQQGQRPQLGWQGSDMSLSLRQGDRHGSGGLHAHGARGRHCMAPGAGGVQTGSLRADATAWQPGRKNNTAAGKTSRPLATDHTRHSMWRQHWGDHTASHTGIQPSRCAPWAYTISMSTVSQQSWRKRWGDGSLQHCPRIFGPQWWESLSLHREPSPTENTRWFWGAWSLQLCLSKQTRALCGPAQAAGTGTDHSPGDGNPCLCLVGAGAPPSPDPWCNLPQEQES